MAVIIDIMQMSIQTVNVTNNALIAKAIGESKSERIKKISGNAVILTIIIAIVTIILVSIIKPIFPVVFNVSTICNTYLTIRLIGFIPNVITTILSGQQRTLGKQGNILKLRIIAVLLNLIFDSIVVYLGYGISGVAWVTVAIDTILATYLLIKTKSTIHYKWELDIIKNIFNLFKWNFVERIVSRIDNFVFNILVSRMGEKDYAVHVILIQINNIVGSFTQGFGDGISISVGVASGRDHKTYMQEVKQIARKITKVAAIVLPIVTLVIAVVIMKVSLQEIELQIIFYKVLPFVLLAIGIGMHATYYFAIIRGVRDFKFLAKRNFITSFIKIVIATILAYTSLGIIGVWISYVIYSILQSYMSKKRMKQIEEIKQ